MKKKIQQFVQSCLICQQAKPKRVAYPGLLSPLPVPAKAWETVTMDFILGLPSSDQYDCIMVVIDKFTKYGHFIPVKHPYTAQKISELFLDNIYKLHGMTRYIVSDRDPVCTSRFWQALMRRTGAVLNMSTTYHPETHGQTERVNQQVESFLRCFISTHPKKWARWISLCEFWYNTNWHSALNKSPFEVLYGQGPRHFGISISDSIDPVDLQQWFSSQCVSICCVFSKE